MKAIFILITLCVVGCVSNPTNTSVEIASSPIDDKTYQDIYESWTQDVQVYHHFDKIHFLTVTKLTPEFLAGFRHRYHTIYKQDPVALQDTSSRTAFFVSIEGPQSDILDISDRNQWSVYLKQQDIKSPPMAIRSLDEKERWKPFFPSINHWTKEFLILFDLPSNESPQLLESTVSHLTLANSKASVILNWNAKQGSTPGQ
ncbi:MAG: hypothetical protein AB8C84_09730 [Oligoflexales bacterium]